MKQKFRTYEDVLETRLDEAVKHDGVVRLAELPSQREAEVRA